MREHDVSALTAAELQAARRELVASLALALARLPGLRTDPSPHGRHRRRTGRTGRRPARVTRLPACSASAGQALVLRKTPRHLCRASPCPPIPISTVTGSRGGRTIANRPRRTR